MVSGIAASAGATGRRLPVDHPSDSSALQWLRLLVINTYLGIINACDVSSCVSFLEKLSATPDRDDSLMSHSFVYYARHDHSRLSTQLTGGGAGSEEGIFHV